MPDMLVKLYDLPLNFDFIAKQAARGITIRKSLPPENHVIADWIRRHFGPGWASEFMASASGPVSHAFVAVDGEKLVGFGCHHATAPGFFGPTGVLESHRKRGIGAALLLACLMEMKLMGYGYAIIGGAGPTDFYAKACGAQTIAGSIPGIYAGMLNADKQV